MSHARPFCAEQLSKPKKESQKDERAKSGKSGQHGVMVAITPRGQVGPVEIFLKSFILGQVLDQTN